MAKSLGWIAVNGKVITDDYGDAVVFASREEAKKHGAPLRLVRHNPPAGALIRANRAT